MIRVRWILSGEIIDYAVDSPDSLPAAIPKQDNCRLSLRWEDLMPDDRELGIAAYAWFDPLTVVVPPVELSAAAIHYDWFDWLSTCTNEDILHRYTALVQNDSKSSPEWVSWWCTNPHPIVVQHILTLLSIRVERDWISNVSANPSETIVDWLLLHPQCIHPRLAARNPHPKLLPYLLEHLTHPRMDDRWLALLPHPEILSHLWKKHGERCLPWMKSNHSPTAVQLMIDWLSMHSPRFKFLPSTNALVIARWIAYAEHKMDQVLRAQFLASTNLFHTQDDQLIDWLLGKLSTIRREEWFHELSVNSHPKVVEWMHAHQTFRFPSLLSNSHPLAIELSQQWMLTQEKITPPMILYLKQNTSLEMALWVARHYVQLPIWQSTLIGMLGAFPEVRVVWEEREEEFQNE